jgi:ankyrin repeat protein
MLIWVCCSLENTMARTESDLWMAASKGDEESVSSILTQNDLDLNWTDSRGVTSLMIAATNGEAGVAKLLLQMSGIGGQGWQNATHAGCNFWSSECG